MLSRNLKRSALSHQCFFLSIINFFYAGKTNCICIVVWEKFVEFNHEQNTLFFLDLVKLLDRLPDFAVGAVIKVLWSLI